MKNKTVLALASLFCALLTSAEGAGVAAYKEQSFHADSSAIPIAYSAILGSTPISMSLDVGGKQASYDRSKIVATVDVFALPDNIRNESELAFVRKGYSDIKAFADRYTKCAPLLQPYIDGFGDGISRFQAGEVRNAGAWMSKESYANILKQQSDMAEARRKQVAEEAEKMRIQREKYEEFAKSQRAKGLEIYGDKWLPRDEALALQKQDQQKSAAWEKVKTKSIFTAVYSIFQVLEKGMLIEPRRGQLQNGGINVDIAYLADAIEAAAAEGDLYKGNLYWCGNYSYRTKGGDDTTINAYCLDRDAAISRVTKILFGEEEPKHERPAVASEDTDSPSNLPKPLKGAKGSGSGFFVGNDGYFVTNAHVVDDSTNVSIYYSGKMLPAEVIKVSKVADLAILKVRQKVAGLEISGDEPQPGSDIFAIGYPQPSIQGLEVKITKGIVSSSRGLDDDDTRFQIDAAVQPGNSGGPLCDSSGRLVGVVVAGLNQIAVAKLTGNLPQNVNYGIKATEVSALLRSKSIDTAVSPDSSGKQASGTIKMASGCTGLVIVK